MDTNEILDEIRQQIIEAFISQDPTLFDVVFEIDGKLIYADKLHLSIASSTFKTMLSDRWISNKNEPIKIKEYKFEDFNELLTFIYSGKCNITDTNIFTILDLAEFYQIKHLKKICEKYLSKMKVDLGNIFQLIEASNKYFLTQTKKSINTFVNQNFGEFVKCMDFLNASKEFIEILMSTKIIATPDENFQAVYEWSEYQVIKKQKESINDENFNKNDAIKAEISPFLQNIDFKKMSLKFLVQYVVKRGFLFSYDELSEILDIARTEVKVKITNSHGQSLYGSLPSDSDAIEVIKSLKNCFSVNFAGINSIWWNTRCKIPSPPSSIKKREGVQWYLVYYTKTTNFGVEHFTQIKTENHYLLAEMTENGMEFCGTEKCKIEIIE